MDNEKLIEEQKIKSGREEIDRLMNDNTMDYNHKKEALELMAQAGGGDKATKTVANQARKVLESMEMSAASSRHDQRWKAEMKEYENAQNKQKSKEPGAGGKTPSSPKAGKAPSKSGPDLDLETSVRQTTQSARGVTQQMNKSLNQHRQNQQSRQQAQKEQKAKEQSQDRGRQQSGRGGR